MCFKIQSRLYTITTGSMAVNRLKAMKWKHTSKTHGFIMYISDDIDLHSCFVEKHIYILKAWH